MQSSAQFWTWKLNSKWNWLRKRQKWAAESSWKTCNQIFRLQIVNSTYIYRIELELCIWVDKRRLISMEIRSSFHKLIKTFCIQVDERYQRRFYAYVNWVYLSTDNISREVLNIEPLRSFFFSHLCFGSSVYDPSSDSFNSSICTCTLKLPVLFYFSFFASHFFWKRFRWMSLNRYNPIPSILVVFVM